MIVTTKMTEIDCQEPDQHKRVEAEWLGDNLRTVLKTLTTREQAVIALRMEELTFAEIGGFIGLKRESVRQVYEKALRKLRHPKRILLLHGFLSPSTIKQ